MRLAQLDRAFGYGPKGRGFESSNAQKILISRELNEKRHPVGDVFFRGAPGSEHFIIEQTLLPIKMGVFFCWILLYDGRKMKGESYRCMKLLEM